MCAYQKGGHCRGGRYVHVEQTCMASGVLKSLAQTVIAQFVNIVIQGTCRARGYYFPGVQGRA